MLGVSMGWPPPMGTSASGAGAWHAERCFARRGGANRLHLEPGGQANASDHFTLRKEAPGLDVDVAAACATAAWSSGHTPKHGPLQPRLEPGD